MHTEALARETRNGLEILGKSKLLQDFYLAGGTALALHYGHRISVDLDFFTQKRFDPKKMASVLSKEGNFITEGQEEGTLHGIFEGAKASFLYYPYRLLKKPLSEESFTIADPLDIGCMKIDAIASRGKKKDFVDLYFLMQHYALSELLRAYEEKYSEITYDMMHIMKSILYFDDADQDPDVIFLGKKISWTSVKRQIEIELKKVKYI